VSFKFGARRDLRIHPALTALHQVLADLREVRPNFRVIAFSLQHDHLHILVEADSPKAFASGIRAFAIRAGKRLNQALGRTGRLFADRHHRRVLRTPTEVRAPGSSPSRASEVFGRRRGESDGGDSSTTNCGCTELSSPETDRIAEARLAPGATVQSFPDSMI
jgi:hypothetical protein